MFKTLTVVTFLAVTSSAFAQEARQHTAGLDLGRTQVSEPGEKMITAGTLVLKKEHSGGTWPYLRLPFPSSEVIRLSTCNAVCKDAIDACKDGQDCVVWYTASERGDNKTADVVRFETSKSALFLNEFRRFFGDSNLPYDETNEFLNGVSQEEFAAKQPELHKELLEKVKEAKLDDISKKRIIFINSENYGASANNFVNLDPNAIVVLGPKYTNHDGVYSVGPVYAKAHSMGPVISKSWTFAAPGSFLRNKVVGSPVVIGTGGLSQIEISKETSVINSKGAPITQHYWE